MLIVFCRFQKYFEYKYIITQVHREEKRREE